jgi:putative SOS response-associated peptidase YedK
MPDQEWRMARPRKKPQSCTVLITHPNTSLEVHDRMPALLVEKGYDAWLDGSAGGELLKPASDNALQRSPVSKRVNSSMAPADDSTLIDRIDLEAAWRSINLEVWEKSLGALNIRGETAIDCNFPVK